MEPRLDGTERVSLWLHGFASPYSRRKSSNCLVVAMHPAGLLRYDDPAVPMGVVFGRGDPPGTFRPLSHMYVLTLRLLRDLCALRGLPFRVVRAEAEVAAVGGTELGDEVLGLLKVGRGTVGVGIPGGGEFLIDL